MYSKLIKFLAIERLHHLIFGVKPGQQWCRVVMDQETEKMISVLPFSGFSVLEISGNKWADFGFKNYKSVSFPQFDICSERLEEEFDLIIAEQVFEHLLKPYSAAKNVYAMLRNHGYFLVTTPFLIKIHLFPEDCSRWTETGLKYFLHECGFSLDTKTGSWGNLECVVSNFNKWTNYNPSLHSLKNQREVPMVVWALAKKQQPEDFKTIQKTHDKILTEK